MPTPEETIARKQPPRKQRARKPRPRKTPRRGKTFAQFRADYGIGRSTWDEWGRRGLRPDILQPGGDGGRGVILPEAEAAWIARFTKSTAVTEDAE
jgi:hypothetical protein